MHEKLKFLFLVVLARATTRSTSTDASLRCITERRFYNIKKLELNGWQWVIEILVTSTCELQGEKVKNITKALAKDDGQVVEYPAELEVIATEFYRALYSSRGYPICMKLLTWSRVKFLFQ